MTLKMTTLQRCLNFLDCRRIRYAHTTHSPAYTAREVAAKEFLPLHAVAKAVVLLGDGYLFAVVPADKQVSLAQMRLATGVAHLQLASEAELFQLFPNSDLGAMPPLGPLFDIPVYVDREVAEQEYIAFNGGTHRDVIHMRTEDFLALVKPVVGDFGRQELPATVPA